ncbi:MAG: glycosyltransferase family 4 protein [Eubacteriales bacterium]|nr:glycosyltransferase family 4 protein [Eubacteriales bacterium]
MNERTVWLCNHYAAPPAMTTLIRPYLFGKILTERGYAVRVFASSKIHNMDVNTITDARPYLAREEEGVPFVYIRTSGYEKNDLRRVRNILQYFFGLLRAARRFPPPDVIVATSAHPLTCVAGIRLARRYGVPCIVEIGDLWPESLVAYDMLSARSPVTRALYRLEKWIYRKADALVFTMQGGADYIRDRGWQDAVDLNKVTHINNGVDLAAFDENVRTMTLDDDALDDESAFKVVYVGSIRQVNDVGKLLDVAAELKRRGEETVRFIIYGDGTQRAELARRARDEGLDNVLLRGFVAKKYIPYVLSRSNLNIIQVKQTEIMRYGSSMNKLFDYFASGKPVLSTLRVNYDLIAQHNCGMTTRTQQPGEIADAILKFARMPREEYDAYCARARKAAREFDYPRLVDKLEAVMQTLWRRRETEVKQ